MALRLPHLGPRTRRVLRYVGYFVLAVVTFVFALQLTFPYHRVKDKIVEVLSTKYDVTIADVERGIIPGRLYFKNVSLRTRPSKSDEPVSTLYIESLRVDLGLLALITGTASVGIDAKIGGGHITGTVALSKDGTSVHMEGTSLPSASLPMREGIGLPMSGLIEIGFDLELPNEKNKTGRTAPNWAKAEGGAEFSCPTGCVFGDGKSRLKFKVKNTRNQAFASEGIEFGKLNIQSLVAKLEIKDGHMAIRKFDAKSDDGTLFVEYDQTLAPEFGESTVAGCLRFTGSQALLKREAKTFAAISTTGAPLGPDNLYHIRLDGKFKEMKRLGQICGQGVSDKNMDNPGGTAAPARPNLTVQPDEPIRTPETPPQYTPPPPVAPDASTFVPVPEATRPVEGDGHGSNTGHGSGEPANGPGTTGAAPVGEPSRRN